MTILAFFFLLWPGEYTGGASNTVPFCFQDVQLFIGLTRIDLVMANIEFLHQATFGTLTFTNQKNGIRNKVIGHDSSGDPVLLCPVKALIRCVVHLRLHNALPTTPLAMCYQVASPQPILPHHITEALQTAVLNLGPTLGFLPDDGATALLCANVDDCHISLLGQWQQKMNDFSHKMLHGSTSNLIPNQKVSSY